MTGKVASMRDAIADLVRDGDTVAIEGFTHLICFAAGHEIIRQRKRDLTLARLTPDLIYDQMIAGGVARKLIFSWLGNPGVGGLGAIRRRIEDADPAPLEVEEYSHFGMVGRYTAGATNLPFYPLRSYFETDLPSANPLIRPIESPYGDGTVYAVPPLKPAVLFCPDDRLIVRAELAQEFAGGVREGLSAVVKEDAGAGSRSWRGQVTHVSRWFARQRSVLLEPGQVNDVRTLECIITLDDGRGHRDDLRIGQRVHVIIHKKKDAR